MERLTKRTNDGMAYTVIPLNESNIGFQCFTGFVADKLAAYEDTGLEPGDVQDLKDCAEGEEGAEGTIDDLLELMRYRKLEDEGKLIKLPCKVGTKVFFTKRTITYIGTVGKRESYSVEEMFLTKENLFDVIAAWNETVFLTKEEAEQALEGAKDEQTR